ncbi:MAG: hypothetical protein DI538_06165 [Azospira oryzae]|nr:MAG: hypothetical protein DI538_06165 [Azospira oryzae]
MQKNKMQMQSIDNGLPVDTYGSVEQIIKTSSQQSPKAVVITPTTGSNFLYQAIRSVLTQSMSDIIHLIVIDGAQHEAAVLKITSQFNSDRCKVITLPFNTGQGGMNGHRIYAAFPLLINAEYLFFLDEDNWWDEHHAESLISLMEQTPLDWAYSMRKIYTFDGLYVADDNCESIGPYPPYSNIIKHWSSYIDTNCYAFKRTTIAQTAHYWYHPLRADRYFFEKLAAAFPDYLSSKEFSCNYRLKQNGPVSSDYIIEGNKYMRKRYGERLPWL